MQCDLRMRARRRLPVSRDVGFRLRKVSATFKIVLIELIF